MIEKEFSQEFQKELLNLFKMCLDHHTNSLTLGFKYQHTILAVEMTFKGENYALIPKIDKDGNPVPAVLIGMKA